MLAAMERSPIAHTSERVVFFDATGTLIEPRDSVGRTYSRFADEFGFGYQGESAELAELLQKRFLWLFPRQPPMAFPYGLSEPARREREFDWWRSLLRQIFVNSVPFSRFDEFCASVFEFFRVAEAWKVFPDVVPALESLAQQKVRLAVISNFDSRLEDVLKALDLRDYFEAVHISTRLGAAKPDPKIFRLALAAHNLPVPAALHIGDSVTEDVQGAQAAGMSAIWLDRDCSGVKNESEIRITRLDQLPELLFPNHF